MCYLKGIDLRACSKTAVPVFQAMSRPELLKVLAAETSQRDGDTDDITANFAAQVQALHNNAPAGNDSDSDESACKADQDDLEFDAMVLEDMDPEDRREFEQVQKTIEKHQARAKQKEWAVVRKAMMPKAKAKGQGKGQDKGQVQGQDKGQGQGKQQSQHNKGAEDCQIKQLQSGQQGEQEDLAWRTEEEKTRLPCSSRR